jgi:hypothetical protein
MEPARAFRRALVAFVYPSVLQASAPWTGALLERLRLKLRLQKVGHICVLFIPGFNVRQPSRKRTIFDVWCSDPS